jgi:hypothetical protein
MSSLTRRLGNVTLRTLSAKQRALEFRMLECSNARMLEWARMLEC